MEKYELKLTKHQLLLVKEAIDTLLAKTLQEEERFKGYNLMTTILKCDETLAKDILEIIEQIPL